MRRSTAAAIGTLTGAALIVGVRLSVQPPEAPVGGGSIDLANNVPSDKPTSRKPSAKPTSSASKNGNKGGNSQENDDKGQEADKEATKKPTQEPTTEAPKEDKEVQGDGIRNPYGVVTVTIKVDGDGVVTEASATTPQEGQAAQINGRAIPLLNDEAKGVTKAEDVAAVSGATYTSDGYIRSLQSALDKAKA